MVGPDFCHSVGLVRITKGLHMEIRIGMINTSREIGLETSQTLAEVETLVANSLSGTSSVLKLSDDKGKVYLVASANIAFVELGSDQNRRIGFVG